MNERSVILGTLLGFVSIGIGCGQGVSPRQGAANASDVYSIGLTADSVPLLPACTPSLSGTVAFVSSPPTLLVCSGRHWQEIPCTDRNAGAVGYASRPQVLLACVGDTWTKIAIPPGATGPQGPTGLQGPAGENSLVLVSTEPSGANCALGGLRVDAGLDSNNDGVLENGEIQRSAYVCAVGPSGGGSDAGAPPVDGSPDGAGGQADGGGGMYTSDGGGGACIASDPNGVWTTEPHNSFIVSVAAVTPDDIWAVDGNVEHWEGTSWTTMLSPTGPQSFSYVWASGPRDVWVAGDLLRHWDGSGWTDTGFPAVDSARVIQIWGLGANDTWVVLARQSETSNPVFHWDGVQWTETGAASGILQPVANVIINAVWGASTNDVWGFGITNLSGGGSRAGIVHWNGNSWSPFGVISDPNLRGWINGATGTAADDIWLTGYDDTAGAALWHFDGSSFVRAAVFAPLDIAGLPWVSCSHEVWVPVEDYKRARLAHYRDGTSSVVELPGLEVRTVTGTASGEIWAGGESDSLGGALFHLHTTSSNVPVCGNARIETGEACDPPDGLTCDQSCQLIPTCGNGRLDPGEQCDFAIPSPLVCDSTCHLATCGNGHLDPGEECDPPNRQGDGMPTPWCDSTCHIPRCGNGVVDPGETCDPPAGWSPGHGTTLFCGPACTLVDACTDCPQTCDSSNCTPACQLLRSYHYCPGGSGGAGGGAGGMVGAGGMAGAGGGLAGAAGGASGGTGGASGGLGGNWSTQTGTSVPDLFAVPGDQVWRTTETTVDRWNGTSWTTVLSQDPVTPAVSPYYSMISATGPNDIWVVDRVLRHFDGVSWSDRTPPGESDVGDIWSLAPNDVWVVGTTPFHWDGQTWTARPIPPLSIPVPGAVESVNPDIAAIWGSGPTDVWAFGSMTYLAYTRQTGVFMHWDGGSWTFWGDPNDPALQGQQIEYGWGSAANDVWAVAYVNNSVTALWHFDGTAWTTVDSRSGSPGSGHRFVWGSGPADVWAAGPSLLWHFDGASLSTLSLGAVAFTAGASPSQNETWAAGYFYGGARVLYHRQGP